MQRSYLRREVLTALALGAAVSQGAAQQKITQADASYQVTPKGDQRCAGCFNFQQPNACRFIQGTISPSGWCQLYAPRA
ncbi:MAG TPA: hypothetical protein VL614_23365 [Acetobacteraceae bacterium]|jgi:hypothetical protein|nr:hypothetical protein [Acetobacteraceae bacterium]